ncbi:hypothetical protein DERF_013108 [Dermatophagoides farinae]|uniref:Uncharacterized protein n=1 Tax=Dermatophagoides farinae TaxID=6954 RepID=A0A922HLB9_DERFA|nr:hypothetical protein DERF_013108 [Dermatophagoides farinae]
MGIKILFCFVITKIECCVCFEHSCSKCANSQFLNIRSLIPVVNREIQKFFFVLFFVTSMMTNTIENWSNILFAFQSFDSRI